MNTLEATAILTAPLRAAAATATATATAEPGQPVSRCQRAQRAAGEPPSPCQSNGCSLSFWCGRKGRNEGRMKKEE